VPIERQLSTLRRWLIALTVITIALAITVFVLASTRLNAIFYLGNSIWGGRFFEALRHANALSPQR